LHHLSCVHLHNEQAFLALCKVSQLAFGERPERDGAEKSHTYAFFASQLYSLFGHARRTAKGYENVFGIIGVKCFETHLIVAYLFVLGLQGPVLYFHQLGTQFERGDDIGFATAGATC
jgi:hypothetical protein